jgi:hypothetical protein
LHPIVTRSPSWTPRLATPTASTKLLGHMQDWCGRRLLQYTCQRTRCS